MAGTAKKTNPRLWDKVKAKVTAGDKGGRPGQWSARKAQMATSAYQQAGGGYAGAKGKDNHLDEWTREEWGTRSGRPSRDSGERYLPRQARRQLTEEEYSRSTAAKRRDTKAGKQFSRQPKDVARKAARARTTGTAGKAAARQAPTRKASSRKAPAGKPGTARTTTRRPATKAATRKVPARSTKARKPARRKQGGGS